jgi:hypothetical protein
VIPLIVAGYTPLSFDSPWYVGDDLFDASFHRRPRSAGTELDFLPTVKRIMRRSGEFGSFVSITIAMAPGYEERRAPIRRIGTMLSTYGRSNSGEAELGLQAGDGSSFSRHFPLSAVADNRYAYFDVDSKWYERGELHSLTGEGISTWESDLDGSYICMIYEYVDDSRGYTPACPIM